RAEQGGVLDAGVDGVRLRRRGLEVPDALELPGPRRAVVPLVGAGGALVGELVADRVPALAAVAGLLDELAEPAGILRRIEPIGVGRRALEVVDLPGGEGWWSDGPGVAPAIRSQDEGAFACTDQDTDGAHADGLLPRISRAYTGGIPTMGFPGIPLFSLRNSTGRARQFCTTQYRTAVLHPQAKHRRLPD